MYVACSIYTCVGEVGLDVVVCRRCDLPFRSLRKDSRSDFLNDFLLDIGVSPEPESVEDKFNLVI